MPQPKKGARLGGDPAHQKAILANLTTELFRHGRVQTTHAKAKTVQPLAEKMITFGKRGDVHARRQVLRVVRDRDVVHKLFADIGPANAERDGGYTRVLRLGPRKGDSAQMALIELVEVISSDDGADLTEEPRRRWSLRRRAGGTRSAKAQAREEERAASAPPVPLSETDEPEADEEAVGATDDATDVGGATRAGSLGIVREDAAVETGGVEADPAEVEARFASQDVAVGEGDVDEVGVEPEEFTYEDDDAVVTEAPADSSVPYEDDPLEDDPEGDDDRPAS